MRVSVSLLLLFTIALVLVRSPLGELRGAGEIASVDPSVTRIVCGGLGLALVLLFAKSYRGTRIRLAASMVTLFAGPAAIAESHLRLAKPYSDLVTPRFGETRPEAVFLWFPGAFLLLLAMRILGRKEQRGFAHCAAGAVLILLFLLP